MCFKYLLNPSSMIVCSTLCILAIISPGICGTPFAYLTYNFRPPSYLILIKVNHTRTYLCPIFPLQIGVSRSLYVSLFVLIGETSVLCNVLTIRLLPLYFSFAALKGVLELQSHREQCKYNM